MSGHVVLYRFDSVGWDTMDASVVWFMIVAFSHNYTWCHSKQKQEIFYVCYFLIKYLCDALNWNCMERSECLKIELLLCLFVPMIYWIYSIICLISRDFLRYDFFPHNWLHLMGRFCRSYHHYSFCIYSYLVANIPKNLHT